MTDQLEGHLHHRCGGRYGLASESITVRLSGMSASVVRSLFRCDRCGDEQRTVEQRDAAEQAAIERIRADHSLLSPKQIRHLREQLGVTHEQLGALLYGTPRGVVEGWERGRYVQNRETDQMLRGLLDRATLEQRAARAGITLRSPEELEGERAAKAAALALARQRGREERDGPPAEREISATPIGGVRSGDLSEENAELPTEPASVYADPQPEASDRGV